MFKTKNKIKKVKKVKEKQKKQDKQTFQKNIKKTILLDDFNIPHTIQRWVLNATICQQIRLRYNGIIKGVIVTKDKEMIIPNSFTTSDLILFLKVFEVVELYLFFENEDNQSFFSFSYDHIEMFATKNICKDILDWINNIKHTTFDIKEFKFDVSNFNNNQFNDLVNHFPDVVVKIGNYIFSDGGYVIIVDKNNNEKILEVDEFDILSNIDGYSYFIIRSSYSNKSICYCVEDELFCGFGLNSNEELITKNILNGKEIEELD